LDSASLKTLGFVSRRLQSEAVGLIFAARVLPQELAGIAAVPVVGLADAEAQALLDSVAPRATLDRAVRERIIAETAGNPLAIVELAERGYFRELAGGYEVPRSGSVAGWPRNRRAAWTIGNAPTPSCSGVRSSSSRRGAATRRRCCSMRHGR
jgi:hypothetical protein